MAGREGKGWTTAPWPAWTRRARSRSASRTTSCGSRASRGRCTGTAGRRSTTAARPVGALRAGFSERRRAPPLTHEGPGGGAARSRPRSGLPAGSVSCAEQRRNRLRFSGNDRRVHLRYIREDIRHADKGCTEKHPFYAPGLCTGSGTGVFWPVERHGECSLNHRIHRDVREGTANSRNRGHFARTWKS